MGADLTDEEINAAAAQHAEECWETSLIKETFDEIAAIAAHLDTMEHLMSRLHCAVSDDRLIAQKRRIRIMQQMAKSLQRETFEVLLDS